MGGWAWRGVAALLEADGHKCATPTLAGFAERSDAIAPTIDAIVGDIADQTDMVTSPAIIVGHSFGGIVAERFADRFPDRCARLILIDAVLLSAGQCVADVYPQDRVIGAVQAALATGRLPPVDGKAFGLPAGHAAAALLSAMPLAPLFDPLPPPVAAQQVPRSYWFANQTIPTIAPFERVAKARGDGPVAQFTGGHLAMLVNPPSMAAMLSEAAR
jgi:pimeloyl-ACP methyl ester carboxylesterase